MRLLESTHFNSQVQQISKLNQMDTNLGPLLSLAPVRGASGGVPHNLFRKQWGRYVNAHRFTSGAIRASLFPSTCLFSRVLFKKKSRVVIRVVHCVAGKCRMRGFGRFFNATFYLCSTFLQHVVVSM